MNKEQRATQWIINYPHTPDGKYNNSDVDEMMINSYIQGDRDRVAISAKWIRENVGDSVAVDYLKAMEGE